MATVVKSFAIQGVDGYTVDIESKVLDGQPMISIIGMGDVAVKEAGDRIQSAIDESGYVFPKKRVIISLAPGDKKKRGSHFDLAMAIGVLQEGGKYCSKRIESVWFYRRTVIRWKSARMLWNLADDISSKEEWD